MRSRRTERCVEKAYEKGYYLCSDYVGDRLVSYNLARRDTKRPVVRPNGRRSKVETLSDVERNLGLFPRLVYSR